MCVEQVSHEEVAMSNVSFNPLAAWEAVESRHSRLAREAEVSQLLAEPLPA